MSKAHDLGSPSRCINSVHDPGSQSRRINRVHASNSKASRLIRINEPDQPPVSSSGLPKPCQSTVSPPASRYRAEILGYPSQHRARALNRSIRRDHPCDSKDLNGRRGRWITIQAAGRTSSRWRAPCPPAECRSLPVGGVGGVALDPVARAQCR